MQQEKELIQLKEELLDKIQFKKIKPLLPDDCDDWTIGNVILYVRRLIKDTANEA